MNYNIIYGRLNGTKSVGDNQFIKLWVMDLGVESLRKHFAL